MATTIRTAWADAEAYLFNELTEATATVSGDSAFLGYMPSGTVNAFMLDTGGGDEDFADGCYSNIVTTGLVSGLYAERDQAQIKAMEILAAFSESGNFAQKRNIHKCWLNNAPDVTTQELPFKDGVAILTTLTIDLTLAFSTIDDFDD